MQKGDFRQAMQMGAMAGTISSFCIIAKDGYVHPEEGPVTIDMLNKLTSEMLKKARSEFNDYLFSYQKAGLNLGEVSLQEQLEDDAVVSKEMWRLWKVRNR